MSLNKETLKIFLEENLKFRRHFFSTLIIVPLSSTVIGVVIPFLLSRIIELLSHSRGLGDDEFMFTLYLTVAASLVAVILNRIGYQQFLTLDYKVRANLQRRAFQALLHKSYSFYANHKVGSLTSHFIGFISASSRITEIIINQAMNLSLTMAVGLVIIFSQSLILGATLLAITAVIVLHTRYTLNLRAPLRKKRKEIISELHGNIADDISNNTVIKMFGQETFETKHVEQKINSLKNIYSKEFRIFAHESNLRHALMLAFQLVAIIVAAWLLGQGAISIGVVIFSLTYLIRLSTNLFTVGPIIHGYEQAMVEANSMTEVLIEANEVQDKPDAKDLKVSKGDIQFKDVLFKYEDDSEHVFDGLNLHIKAGEKIGLVGASGGGKTTVTKLLLRFLDIQKGKIIIDGQDISSVKQQNLRSQIAYVPQEPLLFHRSLRENIAYGKPEANDEEILAAAKKAHAHEFIEKLPHKYDTTVGERGVKLSGGQKQRVAIARAILANAPILVLDEATSALDSASEKAIQAALHELMQYRTAIVIAHRLSTIQQMDRIIVLDEGKIVEEGTHQKLLAKKGHYAKLWAHQTGSFIEE